MGRTLVILAAGIGSRFKGGIKQLVPVGPNGELITEYSVYDAVKAGCDKVIFIIRRDIEQAVKDAVISRLRKYVNTEYCFQELSDIPYSTDISGRTKPWGTVQALLSARKLITDPFVIINADDYYGKDAYEKLFGALSDCPDPRELYMGGFTLKNTLSSVGTVTRGICSTDNNGTLLSVKETYGLSSDSSGTITGEQDGIPVTADPESIVSMNIWGFRPEVLCAFEESFRHFLSDAAASGNILTAEYALPTAVNNIIESSGFSVKVIPTDGVWLGMTRSEDCIGVRRSFSEKVKSGEYISPLFK